MARRGNRLAWGIVVALSMGGTALDFVDAQRAPAANVTNAPVPTTPSTINEMVESAGVVVSDGHNLQTRIGDMIDDARDAHDIIRVTCLTEKQVQVQGTVESAQERVSNLQTAQRDSDLDRAQHEYTLVGVLREKLDVLDRQAAQCAGQDIYETGTTMVSTEVDPNSPEDDSSVVYPPPVVNQVPIIPPPASATM